MTKSEIILQAFGFLTSDYGFDAVRVNESPLTAYVVFKRGDVEVTVDFDGRMSDVVCELHLGAHRYFAAFDEILTHVGGERFDAVPATSETAIQHQLQLLADKTKRYAAPALKGDVKFYERIGALRK